MTVRTQLPIAPVDSGECYAPVTSRVHKDADVDRLARVFKALGDPTRLQLLMMIADSESSEACICDLTAPVGLRQPTVSYHMKQLVDAGLVTREQRGKWAYFQLVPGALTSAIQAADFELL